MTKQKMKQKMKIMSRLALALVVLLTGTLVTATQPRTAQAVGRNELQRALLGTVRVAVALDGKNGYSTGSGTVVSDKGYVVTNFHVVGDTKTGRFYNSQRVAALAINQTNLRGMPNWTYTARVVQSDPKLDVAILKIVGLVDNEKAALPANLGLTVVPIGNSDDVQIADEANQPGKFTAFCSYEWTSMPDGRNLHRNIFFRDCAKVPDYPFSALDSTKPTELWNWMDAQRKGAMSCSPSRTTPTSATARCSRSTSTPPPGGRSTPSGRPHATATSASPR